MTNEKFKQMLALAGFKNKKEFAQSIGYKVATVRVWAYRPGVGECFPQWLEPALNCAIKAKQYEDLIASDPNIFSELKSRNIALKLELEDLLGYSLEDKLKEENKKLKSQVRKEQRLNQIKNARLRHIKRLNRGY